MRTTIVNALAVQADGKILVGGIFTTLGGGGTGTTTRNHIGRLTNTDAALQELTADTNGTTIIWNRSSASPEVDRVTFELSTDAINYTALANPTRITGGWQLTGQSLPTHQNIFIRARGFYSTGGLTAQAQSSRRCATPSSHRHRHRRRLFLKRHMAQATSASICRSPEVPASNVAPAERPVITR